MDIKQIKQVIELMKRAELNEFSVEEEGFKLKIRRGNSGRGKTNQQGSMPPFMVAAEPTAQAAVTAAPTAVAPSAAPAVTNDEEAGFSFIKSPMVGTFYRSPSPDSKAFADIDGKVTETTVVCIVEAMKIMNEIQAEVKGTIVEILAEDGDPIEYGQKLFKVKTG